MRAPEGYTHTHACSLRIRPCPRVACCQTVSGAVGRCQSLSIAVDRCQLVSTGPACGTTFACACRRQGSHAQLARLTLVSHRQSVPNCVVLCQPLAPAAVANPRRLTVNLRPSLSPFVNLRRRVLVLVLVQRNLRKALAMWQVGGQVEQVAASTRASRQLTAGTQARLCFCFVAQPTLFLYPLVRTLLLCFVLFCWRKTNPLSTFLPPRV